MIVETEAYKVPEERSSPSLPSATAEERVRSYIRTESILYRRKMKDMKKAIRRTGLAHSGTTVQDLCRKINIYILKYILVNPLLSQERHI